MFRDETYKHPWIDDGRPLPKSVSMSNSSIGGADHREFRKVLRESLKDGKTIMIAKADKYRAVGKTTTIATYMMFVEDACLFVPNHTQRDMYVKEFGIPTERIIVAKGLDNIMGYTKSKHFVMDEIPYKTYREICQMVYPIKDAKLSGIVTIYGDYLVL